MVARDPESLQWIRDHVSPTCRAEWYPDPVCAMSRPAAVPSVEKTLGVIVRSHRSMVDDLSNVRLIIDEAKKMGYVVKHLVLGVNITGDSDKEVAEAISQPGEEIIYSGSLEELCVAISGCDLLATIKFHGVVVATMYGVPSIAMSVIPNNRNFLRQVGRPEMLGGYT